ncbi:HAMP domain-containing protein [bacterium]|nr:MAG: HAMP domain-containing protein [bacterium]
MNLGLRAKSALALGGCIGVVLVVAVVIGAQTLGAIEDNMGSAFARNVTQLSKQRILAPVQRELVLSQRLADSEVTRQWMLDENNPAKRKLFFAESERYRQFFEDKSVSMVVRKSKHYYFNDNKKPFSDQARFTLSEKVPADKWFFSTMRSKEAFNINVELDVALKLTKVWFNVPVIDTRNGDRIGNAGTGLDLTTFLNRFISKREQGVTPIILNRDGAIQAHPDRRLIDFASINDKGAQHSTIYRLIRNVNEQDAVRAAILAAEEDSDSLPQFWVNLDGKRQLCAVAYIPELKWFVLSAVDVRAAQVIDSSLLLPLLVGAIALLAVLVVAITIAVNRILLAPLLKLTNSARQVAGGNYAVELPHAGGDEMGELTRAFGSMAAQVRSHTDELEGKVEERTRELTTVNQQMASASKQIGDSIQAASLIQNAILPNLEMLQTLSDQHFVMWRPRDVVGGDFYVFRTMPGGCLIGVVDCAGHGVPGAFMTMIAYAALNVSIDNLGPNDPAALLTDMDRRLRAMLHNDPAHSQVATNMDAGLAYVDFESRLVHFSGAKVSLYWCDGEEVGEARGDRHAIGGKRIPSFTNKEMPLDANTTFYLTTDGLLDQAGGPKGYSFGQTRFAELLRRQAGRSLAEQRAAFDAELASYQGDLLQRDDITVLSFRFA